MLNLLLTLLTLAVIGGVAALFTGFFTGGGLGAPESTVPDRALPDGPIGPGELAELRFVRALRGYRMDQVDAAIDRLGAEIESLRAQLAGRDGTDDVRADGVFTDGVADGVADVVPADGEPEVAAEPEAEPEAEPAVASAAAESER